jgi:hypothetical protein
MAKGQQRSNRELKKPKKNAVAKSKPGAASVFAQPAKTSATPSSRKP